MFDNKSEFSVRVGFRYEFRGGVRVRVRVRFRVRVKVRVRLSRGLLPTTSHSIFNSRVGQIAIFSHCQP